MALYILDPSFIIYFVSKRLFVPHSPVDLGRSHYVHQFAYTQ